MAQPNLMWDLITGKTAKKAFNILSTEKKKRDKNTIVDPIGRAPNQSPEGDMFRDALYAQRDVAREYSPEQVAAARNYKYEIPKIDSSNIPYNLPQFGTTPPKNESFKQIASSIGQAGLAMSNTGEPDVLGGTMSGALTGLGYGGPIGALIGAIGGFATTGLNKTQYEEERESREKGKIKAATVYGTDIGQMAEGGFPDSVGGEEGELTPVQMERGERFTVPQGYIYKTKATKTHKQMPDDLITDIIPPDAWVASAAKKMMVTKKQAENITLGFDAITYDEEGNSSAPKENKLSDFFRKERMTPAEVLGIIENKFPTNSLEYDPFARRANVLNLRSRIPIINGLISLTQK